MSLTYYPQRTNTDCLLAGLETLLQRPRETMCELAFYEGGFLSYGSVGDVLATEPKRYGLLIQPVVDHIWRENIPMLIGARMPWHKPEVGSRALHCVVWDGSFLWEGHNQRFMEEDLRELKVVYAIVSEDSRLNRTAGDLSWFKVWDTQCRRTMALPAGELEQVERQCIEAERWDPGCWLEVVG